MQPLNEEQRTLAAQAMDRANAIAARYARNFPRHADELRSSAAWGVVKAAASYIPGQETDWSLWSSAKANYECLDFLRSHEAQRQSAWDEFVAETKPENHDEPGAEPEWNDSIEGMLHGLPAKFRAFCDRVYALGMSPEDAAVELGYSPKHGHKIHRRALALIKKKLGAEPFSGPHRPPPVGLRNNARRKAT